MRQKSFLGEKIFFGQKIIFEQKNVFGPKNYFWQKNKLVFGEKMAKKLLLPEKIIFGRTKKSLTDKSFGRILNRPFLTQISNKIFLPQFSTCGIFFNADEIKNFQFCHVPKKISSKKITFITRILQCRFRSDSSIPSIFTKCLKI